MADSYNQSSSAYRRMILTHSIIRFIVCVLLSVICLLPIIIILMNGTRSSGSIIANGFSIVPGNALSSNWAKLTDPEKGPFSAVYNVWMGYRNSLFISLAATGIGVLFSGLTAYGLTVYSFKLRNFATTFILAVLMIPTQVVSAGFLDFMIKIGWVDNYVPLILPAIASPSTVFFMLQYMRSSFPLDIVEAARIDGSGEMRTFVQIALPILKPAFAVQSIFMFVGNWNNYYTPSIILLSNKLEQRTMSMMVQSVVANDKNIDYGVQYLAIGMSVLPVIIIYLVLSKFIVKGIALGAVKG